MNQVTYDVKCDCGRFLGTVDKTTEAKIKCSNSKCKKLKNVKVVFVSDMLPKPHKH